MCERNGFAAWSTVAVLAIAFTACRGAAPTGAPEAAVVEPIMETGMQATKPTDRETVLTRRFAAKRAAVFAALTEPEQLQRWYAATGFTLAACEVDARVGGRARYVYRRASGRSIEVRAEFTAVEPPHVLAWRESYDFSPLVLQARTTLTESRGATTLRQVLTYASTAERDADFPGVETSSREAYDRLDRHLAARAR